MLSCQAETSCYFAELSRKRNEGWAACLRRPPRPPTSRLLTAVPTVYVLTRKRVHRLTPPANTPSPPLSYPTQPFPTLPCLTIPYRTMPNHTLPYPYRTVPYSYPISFPFQQPDHGGVHLRVPGHTVRIRGFPIHGHGRFYRPLPGLGLAFHRAGHRLLPRGAPVQHIPLQCPRQPLVR